MSRESIDKMIRVGTLVKGNQEDPVEYLKRISGFGFESYQLMYWQTLGDVGLDRLAEPFRNEAEQSGAVVSSLAVFGNPLGDEEIDEITRKGWEDAIDHVKDFGGDLVAGFAGRVRGRPVEDSIERFREVWTPLAERAGEKGVRIAFENCPMRGDWKSGDWNIAFHPRAWELMFEAVPADNLGLEWEPCHQLGQLVDPLPQLKAWLPKVFHIHGKDASVYRDVIERSGVDGPDPWVHHRHPGFGDTNWTDLISILRMGGYHGTIDIEGWHDPVYCDELEMTGQVSALNYLKRCRGGDFVSI